MTRRKRKVANTKIFRGQLYDPNILYEDGIPVPDVLLDMVDAYQLHPFVYSAVSIIASNFAQVPYETWLKDIGGEWVVDEKHPFKRLLEQPNPYQSGYDLRELSAISLEMTGNCYWVVERDKATNIPNEIWLLPSHMVQVVSSATNLYEHYIYNVDDRKIVLPANDVIHFQYSNPKSMIYGQSSILASREDLTADIYASMWNKNFFKNSARPDAILETDKVLDENVRKRMINSWKSMHNGVRNNAKMAILESGIKYKEVHINGKDMDFVQMRKLIRETVYGVFNVPPAIAGVLEYSNYANMKEQNKIFWQYTMLPKIRKFEATLSNRVRNISFRQLSVIQAQMELIEALRPDMEILSRTAKTFVDIGIPLNDVIEKLDLPFEEVEGGEQSRPLSSATPQLPMDPSEEEVDAEEGTQPDMDGTEKAIDPNQVDQKILRSIKWKSYDDKLKAAESLIRSTIRVFFKAQKRRVLEVFRRETRKSMIPLMKKPVGSITIDLIWDEKKENELLKGTVKKPIEKIVVNFANAMAKKVGAELDFDFIDPKAVEWLDKKTSLISTALNSYTKESIDEAIKEAIQEAVAEGYSEGESIDQITDRIEEIYDFAVEGRAERIAVTESASASNFGNLEGMKMADVEKKEWLATHDSHTRDTHLAMDGQVRKIDEDFNSPSGETLEFPGDPTADASEVVNCRCTILPVFDD